jgi:hypothetical protein
MQFDELTTICNNLQASRYRFRPAPVKIKKTRQGMCGNYPEDYRRSHGQENNPHTIVEPG